MSSETAIRISGLGKRYEIYDRPADRLKQSLWCGRKQFFREFWALKDVSFEVNRGETVGIIGRNGAGKSTLLQLINGTLAPTMGTVSCRGRVTGLLELGSGFNPEFTGRENVFLNGSIMGLTQGQISEKFDSIASFADIGDFIDQPVKTYSSGMMMRLAFSVLAHVDPDVLIIDEALSVGDAFFVQKCMRFLREFQKRGALLLVTHDTGAIVNLCQRAIWLEHGRLKAQGSAKEVAEAYLASIIEAQPGVRLSQKVAESVEVGAGASEGKVDQRLKYINTTSYRNDIELLPRDLKEPGFGKDGAKITGVSLLAKNGEPLAWVVGGEPVIFSVKAKAAQHICGALIGFYVKDRLGQKLFGDTTFFSTDGQPVMMNPGQIVEAQFAFDMPLLPVGDYSVCVAIAEGTPEEHTQHHWLHDALIFQAQSSSVSYGCLVGIPMTRVSISVDG